MWNSLRLSIALAMVVLFAMLTGTSCADDTQLKEQLKALERKRNGFVAAGRMDEVEPTINEMIALAKQFQGMERRHLFTGIAYGYLAELRNSQRRYSEAIEYGKITLTSFEKAFDDPTILVVQACNNLAAYYFNNKEYTAAEAELQKALAIHERQKSQDDLIFAKTMNLLGNVYSQQRRFQESERCQQTALTKFEKKLGTEHPDVADSLYCLGLCFYNQNQYLKAEPPLQRAYRIFQKVYGEDHLRTAECLVHLGMLFDAQQNHKKAIFFLERGLEIEEKTSETPVGTLTLCLRVLSNVYRMKGSNEKNEDCYDKAVRLARRALALEEAKFGRESPEITLSLCSLANILRDRGQFAEAIALCERAISIDEKALGTEHPDLARTLVALANCYVKSGMVDQRAEELASRAIAIREKAGMSPQLRFSAYQERAKIRVNRGRYTEAVNDLQIAIDSAEEHRAKVSGSEQDLSLAFTEFAYAYELMMACQGRLGDTSAAWSAAEGHRARSFIDQLHQKKVDLLAGLDRQQTQAFQERENESQLKIAALERKIAALAQRRDVPAIELQERLATLDSELREARDAAIETYRKLRSASPSYRLALTQDFRPTDLETMQTWVNKNEAIVLSFFVGHDYCLLFSLIPNTEPQLRQFSVSAEDAQRLGLKDGTLNTSQLEAFLTVSGKQLWQLLSEPNQAHAAMRRLADFWKELIPDDVKEAILGQKLKRLVIIPDGPLTLFPFETLIVEEAEDPTFLLDVGPPILYAPSATVLLNLASREVQPTPAKLQPVLTVADANYSSSVEVSSNADGSARDDSTARSRYSAAGGLLVRLPYTATESDWVKESFVKQGKQVGRLLKDDATELNVRFNIPGRKIVHLASHGLTDQAYGNFFGALALTPGPRASENPANDGFLTLPEIYELDLKSCELAILSACETNYGPRQKGEGTWALSRGFLVAGARRVVASNWLVDDEAAASLIYYFCSGLSQTNEHPLDHAQALQTAKRLIRKQDRWKSPYYWATFVLVGPQ